MLTTILARIDHGVEVTHCFPRVVQPGRRLGPFFHCPTQEGWTVMWRERQTTMASAISKTSH
jgi:hypothetical protein